MQLVFVLSYYPPYTVGGAERSTYVLARALRDRGHKVTVFAPVLGDEPPQDDDTVNVDLGYRLAERGVALGPGTFDRPRTQRRLAQALAPAIAEADVVHAQTLDLLPGAYFAARRAKRPIVASIRDLGGVCPVAVSLLDGPRVPADCGVVKLERECIPRFAELYGVDRTRLHASGLVRFGTARGRSALLRRCDAVISVGSDLGELYADAGLARREQIVHIPNIAEVSRTSVGAPPAAVGGEPYAVYAGKVSVGKGIGYLLEAIRLARVEAPDLRVALAGQADTRWRARIEAVPGAIALGRLDPDELARLYANARFAVVPSIWPEPFPRAAIEAASAGLPVIGARAGGIPDAIVDGETGLLVPPRDAPALAAALLELWGDADRRASLGASAARDVASRFSAEQVTAEVLALYERIGSGAPV